MLQVCHNISCHILGARQVLARLDGREIRWELASLYADRAAAMKRRDAAMATHDAGKAQFAKLDLQRLDIKIGLLEERAEHLELKSPISGLVVRGDLEMTATGTVTWVDGNKVLAFGHPMFSLGPVNLPLAPSEVVAVISSAFNSFKVSNA